MAPRRRSLHFTQAVDDIVELNDDTEERNRSHSQLPAQHEEPDQYELTEELRRNMDDILEHFNNCIHLFSENKINAKNAFSLHFIDGFSTLLKERHADLQDFSTIGHSLDAGIKIYCCRVDRTYTDALKLASSIQNIIKSKKKHKKLKEIDNRMKTDDDNNENDSSENVSDKSDDESDQRKITAVKKKHRRKAVIFLNNATNKTKNKDIHQSIGYSLKIFQDAHIISVGRFDGTTNSTSLNGKHKYWITSDITNNRINIQTEINISGIRQTATLCPSFRHFVFEENDTTIFEECTSLSVCKNDFDSVNADEEQQIVYDDYDNNNRNNDEISSSPMMVTDYAADDSSNMTVRFKDVLNTKDEFRYFDSLKVSNLLTRAMYAKHWNPFPEKSKSNNRKKCSPKEKSENAEKQCPINFYDTSRLMEIYGSDAPKMTIPKHSWSKVRRIVTPEWDTTIEKLLVLINIRGYFLPNKLYRNKDSIDSDDCELNRTQLLEELRKSDTNDIDDVVHYSNEQNDDDDHYDDDDDEQTDEKNRSQIDVSRLDRETFHLIDEYHNANPININELKNILWQLISERLSDDAGKKDRILFSDICLLVLKNNKYKNAHLTANIICNALLHLANSKKLMIQSVYFEELEHGDLEINFG